MIKKVDMNLSLRSSINKEQPEIYKLLIKHWNPKVGGFSIDDIPVNFNEKKYLRILKNTYEQIVKIYVYGQWKIHSYFYDTFEDKTVCQRCGTKIKYAFTIINLVNKNKMIVGSECINRFIDGEQMNIEVYSKIKDEVPNYEIIKDELRQFLISKSYPHPVSITDKSKGSYKQIINIEKKLGADTLNKTNELIRNLIDVIIPGALENKREIMEYHREMSAREFYCNEEIFDEVSGEKEKVKLIEKNDSFITFNTARRINSSVFYNKYAEKVQSILNIKSLIINRDKSTFILRGLKVEVNNNQFLKIVDEIIFNEHVNILKVFSKMKVKIDKRSMFHDLENEIYKYNDNGFGFQKMSFTFTENEFGEFIEKSNLLSYYIEEIGSGIYIQDVVITERLISILEEQISRIPKSSWRPLREYRELKEAMEENPNNSILDSNDSIENDKMHN